MIRCSAGMLVLFLLVGCAEQADPQPAAGPEPGPAPLADATEMAPDETAEPTEAAPTDANETEAVKTETAGTETAEKETAEPTAVATETIVMKVPGMT